MNLFALPTLGFLELCAIVLLVVGAVIIFIRKPRLTRWLIIAAISVITAAILTPADLLSALILAVMFFGMAILGSRIGVTRQSSAG